MSLAMATTWRPWGHSGVRSVITQATMPTSFCSSSDGVGQGRGQAGVRREGWGLNECQAACRVTPGAPRMLSLRQQEYDQHGNAPMETALPPACLAGGAGDGGEGDAVGAVAGASWGQQLLNLHQLACRECNNRQSVPGHCCAWYTPDNPAGNKK